MILSLCYNVLSAIVNEGKDFLESYHQKAYLLPLSKEDKKAFSCGMLSLFYHYEKISFALENLFPLLSKDSPSYLLSLVTFALLKSKASSPLALQKEYLELALKLRVSQADEAFKSIEEEARKEFSLPENIDRFPEKKLSLEEECPLFIAKDLLSLYSYEKARTELLSLHRRPSSFYYLDPEKEVPALLKKQKRIDLANGITLFETKSPIPIKDQEASGIHRITYPYALLLSSLDLAQVNSRLFFADSHEVYRALLPYYLLKDTLRPEIALLLSERKDYLYLRNRLKSLSGNYASLSLLPYTNALAKTEKGYASYDYAIVKEKGTGMGLAGEKPWLLPFLSLEKALLSQKKALKDLDDSAYFVRKDGALIYYTDSLLESECEEVSEKFLLTHPRFSKEKEDKVFPHLAHSTGGYFAFYRRIR